MDKKNITFINKQHKEQTLECMKLQILILYAWCRYRIIALHSILSSQDQSLAFDIPPSGMRKIVIATNIAETGITIPDVVFVVDCGKVKETR